MQRRQAFRRCKCFSVVNKMGWTLGEGGVVCDLREFSQVGYLTCVLDGVENLARSACVRRNSKIRKLQTVDDCTLTFTPFSTSKEMPLRRRTTHQLAPFVP